MRRILLISALSALALALTGCGGSSHPKAQAGLVSSAGSAGQAQDYKPTGKIIADDGFRPDPNGFSFENYPNFSGGVPQNLAPVNVYDLFGSAVCERGSGSSCVLTPTAAKWMDIENQRMAGGHCMGFSVTALRFFTHELPTNPFGAGTAFGLPIRNNFALQSQLAEDWVYQDLQRVQANKIAGTPTQVLQGLVTALKTSASGAYSSRGYGSRGETYTLVIFKPDGSGGHAITPYAVENQGGGHYVILVYDNNFPGVTRPVYVNTNTDTWKYVGGINPSDTNEIYTGDATTGNFFLLPTTPGEGTQPCPFCNGGGGTGGASAGSTIGASQQYYEITLTGSPRNHAHLLLFSHGRVTGFYHGHYINQIPGAQIVQTLSAQTWNSAPEPAYRVPLSTIVGVVIDGSDLTKPDNESITLLGPGLYGGVEDIKLFPGERDVIAFGGGAKGFVYRTQAGHVSTPGLAIGLQEHGVGYAMAVAAAGTKGGSQIALYTHPDGTLTWDTSGTKGAAFRGGFAIYVVEIERLTRTGNAVWTTAKIVMKRGWQAALSYRNAVPGKPITVYTGPPGHLTHKQQVLPGKHLPGQG